MTEEKQKCPKCSAARMCETEYFVHFECESILEKETGEIGQSKDCRIAALEAELKECREALKPFVRDFVDSPKIPDEFNFTPIITVGDLRRASRLLAKPAKEGGEKNL